MTDRVDPNFQELWNGLTQDEKNTKVSLVVFKSPQEDDIDRVRNWEATIEHLRGYVSVDYVAAEVERHTGTTEIAINAFVRMTVRPRGIPEETYGAVEARGNSLGDAINAAAVYLCQTKLDRL